MTDLRLLLRGRRLGYRHRLRLGLWLHFSPHLGFAPDVDPPACELRGEACVLAFLADCQRQLAVGNDDVGGLLVRDDIHPDDVRRFEGIRDVALGALGPLDDVDLLAAQLVHDRLHAQTALADARAPCVESGLPSADRDLRPRAGLASDPDDLDLAVKDLRHLELEEPLHERLVRAAHDDLRSAKRPTDLEHHDLARLPREVPFVRSLLGARQDRRRPAVELHDRRAGVEVADLGVDDVALAVGVLGEDLIALGFAERLLDHLLCRLGADPSERGGGLLERDHVAELSVRLDLFRRVELDLDLGILDLLDDGLEQEHLEGAGLDVDLDVDVLFIAVGALDGPGDDVADDLFGEALLG